MRIGPYETIAEIGRGGAAAVYRARGPSGEVALKVLRTSDETASQRFRQEIAVQGSLGEGFVPLLDHGLVPGGAFIAMPLLEGGTLRDRLRRGPLGVGQAIELARRLAAAMARAHERGIVHRDLKPENVLFDREGSPFIADLGLAKARPGAGSLTGTGEFFGTAGYMAPEQLDGARDVGPAADVFALGAIAFECLAGASAFPAPGLIAYVKAVHEGAKPLGALRPETPRWLARLVARTLERDPARRPPDARALLRELERGGRRPLGWLLGILLLGAIVAGGGAAVISRPPRAPPPPPPAVAPERKPSEELVASARARAEKDPARARADLEALMAREPRLASAFMARSEIEISTGDLEGALRDADRAVALAKGSAAALALRARIHLFRRELDLTFQDATDALGLDSSCVRALTVRGEACLNRLDPDRALADAEAALALAPGDSEARYLRIRTAIALQDLGTAESLADRFVESSPGDPLACLAKATVLLTRGDNEAALAAVTRSIELAPRSVEALLLRAQLRKIRGDSSGALADGEAILAIDAVNTIAWDGVFELAPPEQRMDLTQRACAAAQKHASCLDFVFFVARHVAPGDPGTAVSLMNGAVEASPLKGLAYKHRAVIFMSLLPPRPVEAREDFDRAAALRPDDPEIPYCRAGVREMLRDRRGAIEDLERSLRLSPNPGLAEQARASLERLGASPR